MDKKDRPMQPNHCLVITTIRKLEMRKFEFICDLGLRWIKILCDAIALYKTLLNQEFLCFLRDHVKAMFLT